MIYFYWVYLISFYIVLLLIFRSLIYFNERQREVDLDGNRYGEEVESVEGVETTIR